ncbi:MAG: hypothetical protein IIB07_10805 [Bacteroidetes bacterium]|nr:hypothetical protein [Bacteroidota bacterium]
MDSNSEYIILTPFGVEYTAKWYLENFYLGTFKNKKESEADYSLLNLEAYENISSFDKLTPEEIEEKLNGYKPVISINRDASEDVVYDMLTYDLKKKLKLVLPELFNAIIEWEEDVKSKVSSLGIDINPRVELFVKVFIFIKLGYTTKYKQLADLFSLPLKLYIEFDKKFDPTQIDP